jgi:hypothetical protein
MGELPQLVQHHVEAKALQIPDEPFPICEGFEPKSLCEKSLSGIAEPLRPLFSDGSKPA